MLKQIRQTRITISKSEVIVLRKAQGVAQADCADCGKQVDMVTPEQAVTLIGLSSLSIYRLVESRQLHFRETLEGHLLICLESLISNSQQLNFLQKQINGEG
jgi:hypothetical protein